VLVDFAANIEGYIADQSRVFCVGKPGESLQRPHHAMMELIQLLAEEGRPGTPTADLYEKAMRFVKKAGLEEGFMGYPDPVPFVGHGVGLEIDEWPIIGRNADFILEEGMVVTLEPKIVLPDAGVVGVENTYVVTPAGMKKLNAYPESITIVPMPSS
jgi:Xaa-Pro aminopeptidase